MDIKAEFAKHEEEFLKYEKITPAIGRPDLHAFNLLDRLVPGKRDLISASAHDEYFLSIDVEELAKVATSEDVLVLVRCGVRYIKDWDSLGLFA